MSGLEDIVEHFQRENRRLRSENFVLMRLMTTLIARHASEHSDPEGYIMTITSGVISALDQLEPLDDQPEIMSEHGAAFCNEIETSALDLLHGDQP